NSKGQFCDNGDSYRTAIFYIDEEQQKLAIQSKNKLEQSEYFNEPVVTKLLPAKKFYPAEDYHQDYYQKNPIRYNYYRFACGRDQRLKELWGESAGKAGSLIPTIKTANE
ncbi:MAG: peptide-methionine (S)-S-oxide reductase, partial [Gammaproteobacteria bacterium]